jgi:hypothetical protein
VSSSASGRLPSANIVSPCHERRDGNLFVPVSPHIWMVSGCASWPDSVGPLWLSGYESMLNSDSSIASYTSQVVPFLLSCSLARTSVLLITTATV